MSRKTIYGFTLMETLTSLAIIAILISLLIPAISKIGDTARTVKQKAQFHAIEAGLESFRSDIGDYPPSSYTKIGSENTGYSGAQKLAEAMIGYDGFGFHPKSQWRSDGKASVDSDSTPELIYDVKNGITSSDGTYKQSSEDNLKVRKGPYIELERANAAKLNSLYVTGNMGNYLSLDTYVLTDVFGKVKNKANGQKTGMPILYFKANTANTKLDPSDSTKYDENVYDLNDNPLALYWDEVPWDMSARHSMQGSVFYSRIKNPNFPGTSANSFADARPYRADSFILLSAGPDGLYGTSDDVYNFVEADK